MDIDWSITSPTILKDELLLADIQLLNTNKDNERRLMAINVLACNIRK